MLDGAAKGAGEPGSLATSQLGTFVTLSTFAGYRTTGPEFTRQVAHSAPEETAKHACWIWRCSSDSTYPISRHFRLIARSAGASPWIATSVCGAHNHPICARQNYFSRKFQSGTARSSPNASVRVRTDAGTPNERRHPRCGRVPHHSLDSVLPAAAHIGRISPAGPSED